MKNLKTVLTFEISSNLGHFRKSSTNMSRCTYYIPPRTVITGILGSIIGQPRDKNPELFTHETSFISLKVINANEKINIMSNYIKDLTKMDIRKQTVEEFIRNPQYKIYFSYDDSVFNTNIYNEVKERLQKKQFFYTPHLGKPKCLATIKYIGEFTITPVPESDNIKIDSIIPLEAVGKVVSENNKLKKENFHNIMDNNRNVIEYKEFLFSDTELVINALKPYYRTSEGENIYEM